MSKVSVVVPVYNVEDYLEKCLDSLIHQTLEEIEILCVDDGSTDHSNELLYIYKNRDPRIQVLEKPNGGLSDARNYGMKFATAPYILFVDSDDFLEPQALEKAAAKLDETGADPRDFRCLSIFYENADQGSDCQPLFRRPRLYAERKSRNDHAHP